MPATQDHAHNHRHTMTAATDALRNAFGIEDPSETAITKIAAKYAAEEAGEMDDSELVKEAFCLHVGELLSEQTPSHLPDAVAAFLP